MIFLPVDLFGSYIKGRENAIDRNWNDLNQSNQVEQGWLNNDNQQLRNWFTEDTYGDRLASSNARGRMDQNSATGSDLNTQIAQVGQPGALAQAAMGSDYQTALRDATQPYTPQIAGNNALFTLGQSADRAAQGQVAIDTAPTIRRQAANNNVAAGNLQGQVIQNNADLLPIQQNVQRGNLELQQTVNNQLQQNPAMLFPATAQAQQTQQPAGVSSTDAQVYSLGASIPVGRTATLNIGGQPVQAGRDNNGVFVVEAGQRRYVTPAQANTTTSTNTTFSFGGLK